MLFSLSFPFIRLYLDIICQVKEYQMDYFGSKLRELREDKDLLLRQLAAEMEIDTALLSKIERGERRANREQVEKAAQVLAFNLDDLLILWLADKVKDVLHGEQMAENVLEFLKKTK